jgi:hypothetical protein
MRAIGFLLIAASGVVLTSCQVAKPAPPKIAPQPDDLLYRGRDWREQEGMASATGKVAEELAKLDASKGMLEKRVARTNRDRSFVYSDSFAAMPRSARKRTGLYLVLGFRQNTGEAAETLNHIAAQLREEGWEAQVVPLDEWGSPDHHAKAIERFLRGNLHKVDRAVMVGFSMGATSWVRWMTNHSRGWPASERRKFRLGVFFAGSFRGAAVAHWGSDGRGLLAALFRAKLADLDDGNGEALASVGYAKEDIWADEKIPALQSMFPGFTTVNYVTIPDGSDGLVARQRNLRKIAGPISRSLPWIGPFDGMVESGSQVLPPTDDTPQWIVRVYASHGITEGRYFTGGEVSEEHGQVKGARPLAAEDMVGDLLRAMPRRLAR